MHKCQMVGFGAVVITLCFIFAWSFFGLLLWVFNGMNPRETIRMVVGESKKDMNHTRQRSNEKWAEYKDENINFR